MGLIPENEIAETLGASLHPVTRGPVCDQHGQTEIPGLFSCGNAAHVNDLVDYVSESGEAAGKAAAMYAVDSGQLTIDRYAEIKIDDKFLYAMPQKIDLTGAPEELVVYFRSRDERGRTRFFAKLGEQVLMKKTFMQLRPPEMERVVLKLKESGIKAGDAIRLEMEEC